MNIQEKPVGSCADASNSRLGIYINDIFLYAEKRPGYFWAIYVPRRHKTMFFISNKVNA